MQGRHARALLPDRSVGAHRCTKTPRDLIQVNGGRDRGMHAGVPNPIEPP
jgi:hypothetical protein